MKNIILDRIKQFAINELQREYGYCGSAESDNSVILNTNDNYGNDIVIKIDSIKEKRNKKIADEQAINMWGQL